jgi:hypothetical protein
MLRATSVSPPVAVVGSDLSMPSRRPSSTPALNRTACKQRLKAKPHGVAARITVCDAFGLVQRRQGQNDRRKVDVH